MSEQAKSDKTSIIEEIRAKLRFLNLIAAFIVITLLAVILRYLFKPFSEKHRGFSATGAYTWGEREPQELNPKFHTSGWYAQAGYFLKPETWEVAFRYGENDPSAVVGPDKITEIRGGLNFFSARHALKVQADFGQIKTETSSGDRKNNELRIQTQFIF